MVWPDGRGLSRHRRARAAGGTGGCRSVAGGRCRRATDGGNRRGRLVGLGAAMVVGLEVEAELLGQAGGRQLRAASGQAEVLEDPAHDGGLGDVRDDRERAAARGAVEGIGEGACDELGPREPAARRPRRRSAEACDGVGVEVGVMGLGAGGGSGRGAAVVVDHEGVAAGRRGCLGASRACTAMTGRATSAAGGRADLEATDGRRREFAPPPRSARRARAGANAVVEGAMLVGTRQGGCQAAEELGGGSRRSASGRPGPALRLS